MGRSLEIDDPLTAAIAPPPNETPAEKAERERKEEEERKVNDEIDEMIRLERVAQRRKRRPVKVLLLGQSESGKSTTLKNFQLTYARKAWQEERSSWRAVIQLNLVRSVTLLLDILASELAGDVLPSMPSAAFSDDPRSNSSSRRGNEHSSQKFQFTEIHHVLKLRLGPLRRVQKDLEKRLGSGSEELQHMNIPTVAAPFENEGNGNGSANGSGGSPYTNGTSEWAFQPNGMPARHPQEFFVRSSTGWKSALDKLRPGRASSEEARGLRERREREADETSMVIAGCREDIKTLWEDPMIQNVLAMKRIRLEDSPGFFLNDVDRVAIVDYEPSDDDVIRARLRTIGVQEYRFIFDKAGLDVGHEWLMYDVGGARSLRHAWAPFFDDVNAIIFLAPISCFDEKLSEDRRINRLEDSFVLWKAVCSNKIIAKTQIILFLNKFDLLEKKLSFGIRFRDTVPSFGDRENNSSTVVKYLRGKFKDMSRQYSSVPRPFYCHQTSVIDTKGTAITLSAVREGILRDHLRDADFI